MTVNLVKAEWFKRSRTSQLEADISQDILSCMVVRGKDVKINQFKIRLRNNPLYSNSTFSGKYVNRTSDDIRIEKDDIIKIWMKRATTDESITSSDFLMTGIVKKATRQFSSEENILSIEGVDYSYNLLNKVWPKSYSSQPTPLTVIQLVKNITSSPTGDGSLLINASSASGTGFVTGTRKSTADDGITTVADTGWPTRSLGNYMKPAYTYIDMLSSPEFTNFDDELDGTLPLVYSRNFHWHIDESLNLHWFYPDDDIDDTLTVGTDDEILDYNVSDTLMEAFNMVIWNAGKDENGTAMQGYLYNINTKESDLKIRFLPFTDIGNELRDRQGLTGSTLQSRVKEAVEARINRMFSVGAKEKLKGTLNLRGGKRDVGDVINLIDTSRGLNASFRIAQATYNVDENGFQTTLNIEEDQDKTIGVLSSA